MPVPTNWGPPSIADSISGFTNNFVQLMKDRQVENVMSNLPRTPSGAVDYQAAAQALMRIDPKSAALLMQHGQFETNKAFQQQQFGLQERQFASTEAHQRAQEQHARNQLAALEAQRKEQHAFQQQQLNKPTFQEWEEPESGDKYILRIDPATGKAEFVLPPGFKPPTGAVPPVVPGPTSTTPQPQKRSDIQQTEGPSLVAETTEPAPPKPAVATETAPAAPAAGGSLVPTKKDIDDLRKNPGQAAQFDRFFNTPGAAEAFLRAPREQVDAMLAGSVAAPAQPAGAPPAEASGNVMAVPPGVRAKDWRKAATTELAKKRMDAIAARVEAGRAIEAHVPSAEGALEAFTKLAENGAIGPWQGNRFSQLALKYGTSNPLFQNSPAGQMAALRDAYNMYIGQLRLMQTQTLMKGQGSISNEERKLVAMTLPELDTTNPKVGIERLKQIVEQMNRIRADAQLLSQ